MLIIAAAGGTVYLWLTQHWGLEVYKFMMLFPSLLMISVISHWLTALKTPWDAQDATLRNRALILAGVVFMTVLLPWQLHLVHHYGGLMSVTQNTIEWASAIIFAYMAIGVVSGWIMSFRFGYEFVFKPST